MAPAAPAAAPASPFGDWSAGASPREIGRRVAENFLARRFLWQTKERTSMVYFEVCAWYGALTFAETTGDAGLRQRLRLSRLVSGCLPDGPHDP